MSHLTDDEDWPRLFDLIENRGFLARQAEVCGDFEASTGDVEAYAVPAALGLRDWNRFLHFSLLAVNLRGLAEALANPAVLRALAQGGQLALARGATARLANPVQRAAARATLAASCRDHEETFQELLRNVGRDLEEVAPDAEIREEIVAALGAIARSLGADLQHAWRSWIARLVPEAPARRRIWRAVAESWLERRDPAAPGLWEALRAIGEAETLLELAPGALGGLTLEDPGGTLERLLSLFPEGSAERWQAAALFLARRARHDPDEAVALWQRLASASPVPWSAALVEAAGGLVGLLPRDDSVADPTTRAALAVAALEHRRDARLASLALEAVQQISDPVPRLHWSLRYLAACPRSEEVARPVGAVLRYLAEIRYDAPARDLARYLDLVAEDLPKELRYEVENVLWSPAGRPETLRTLVENAMQPDALRNILEHAERYAAAVAPTEAEGFQLRGEILILAACRLCTLKGDLKALDTAAERLLPEEEDELRSSLARALADAPEAHELVREVCDGIYDRRLRLLTRLECLNPQHRPGDILAPAALYAALASVAALEDERLALAALLDSPLQLRELAARTVARIRDRERQNQALLHLADHALAFEADAFGKRQDRAAAVELVRGSLAIGSDGRLAALTPEIARLGARRGGSLAVAELQEAARRLLGLAAVPWPRRLAALERLLSYFPSLFESDRRAAAVLETLARLPAELDEVRRHWHEALPLLVAATDRLEPKAARALGPAFRAGAEAAPGLARSFLELCLLPREERVRRSQEILEQSPPAAALEALPYLLAWGEPREATAPGVLQAVQKLPAGVERDEICLRLLRHGWVPAGTREPLAALVQDEDRLTEAHLWLDPHAPSWLPDLARLVVRGGADLFDPVFEPLLPCLGEQPSPQREEILGRAALDALRSGGRGRGETALRLWLHALLPPRPGVPQPERLKRCTDLQSLLERALALAPAEPILHGGRNHEAQQTP